MLWFKKYNRKNIDYSYKMLDKMQQLEIVKNKKYFI